MALQLFVGSVAPSLTMCFISIWALASCAWLHKYVQCMETGALCIIFMLNNEY